VARSLTPGVGHLKITASKGPQVPAVTEGLVASQFVAIWKRPGWWHLPGAAQHMSLVVRESSQATAVPVLLMVGREVSFRWLYGL
jgi:hypothetical protein